MAIRRTALRHLLDAMLVTLAFATVSGIALFARPGTGPVGLDRSASSREAVAASTGVALLAGWEAVATEGAPPARSPAETDLASTISKEDTP